MVTIDASSCLGRDCLHTSENINGTVQVGCLHLMLTYVVPKVMLLPWKFVTPSYYSSPGTSRQKYKKYKREKIILAWTHAQVTELFSTILSPMTTVETVAQWALFPYLHPPALSACAAWAWESGGLLYNMPWYLELPRELIGLDNLWKDKVVLCASVHCKGEQNFMSWFTFSGDLVLRV